MDNLILPIWPNWNSTEPKGLFWSPLLVTVWLQFKKVELEVFISLVPELIHLVHELEFLISEFGIFKKVDLFKMKFLSGRKKSTYYIAKIACRAMEFKKWSSFQISDENSIAKLISVNKTHAIIASPTIRCQQFPCSQQSVAWLFKMASENLDGFHLRRLDIKGFGAAFHILIALISTI